MARIVARAQTDFRDFDISHAWAQRFNVEAGTGGGFSFLGVSYESAYVLEFDRPDFTDGFIKLYGTGLVQDGSNVLTGGLVQAIEIGFKEGIATISEATFSGVSISAVTLHNAMRTAALVDDRAALRSMLDGNDRISLSNRGDFAYGGTGNDTVYGLKGYDTLNGNAGNDSLYGSDGLDSLFGNEGRDRLSGGNHADFLQGGKGIDTLSGGAGVDVFSFRLGDGNDRVLDWVDGQDELRFYGPISNNIPIVLKETAEGHVTVEVFDVIILVEDAKIADFNQIMGGGYLSLL